MRKEDRMTNIHIGDIKLSLVEDCPATRINYTTLTECRGGKIVDFSGRTVVFTDEDCPACKGRGEILTDMGKEVVRVVKAFWEDELE
jgi:hypothetical protein